MLAHHAQYRFVHCCSRMEHGQMDGRQVDWPVQGVVKGALVHVRDTTSARARHLAEELLALGERLDASNHCLTERAEESATAATQVGRRCQNDARFQKSIRLTRKSALALLTCSV